MMRKTVLTITMNPAVDKTVTVERFLYGELNRIQRVRTDAGGKGINVAKVLKNFSQEVVTWGFIAGHSGQLLLNMLNEQSIASQFFETEGQTRTNLKIVDELTKQTTELNEPGFSPNKESLERLFSKYKAEVGSMAFVVLGGSLPPEVPADLYAQFIHIANEQGIRTVLDADGEAFALGVEAAPFAVKPNIHELETLFGTSFSSDQQIIDAARELLSKGIQYVLVSMGGKGSILVTSQQVIRAEPVPITPLSTVGAGDSMVAAMIHCFLEGKSNEELAQWCSAAGSVTASKAGAEVCTRAEVEEKVGRVRVSRLFHPIESNLGRNET